ncbi:MAG: PhzF family phenazine biosynthesis protein [bacterium]
MRIAFRQWDVFTDRALGGNPLGIFPDAAQLSTELMQQLTREMNLSECTFICGGGNSRYRVRIFTPEREMIFAGHPVVGTAAFIFSELEADAEGIEFELMRDVVRIERVMHGERRLVAFDSPPVSWHGSLDDRELAARLVSLDSAQLDDSLPVGLLDVGPTYCIIPLRDRAALEAAQYDNTALKELAARHGTDQITVVCPGGYAGGGSFSTRMFAPLHGVPEDPATGSSACCMAAYLHRFGKLDSGKDSFHGLDQGYSIHRPSRIWFRAEGDADSPRIRIAGEALEVASGEFRL